MEALGTVQNYRYSRQMVSLYGEDFVTETTTPKRVRNVPQRSVKVDGTTAKEQRWDNVVWFPSESATTLARLREFKLWGDGWDGEGSPAPDSGLVDTAIALHALLLNTRLSFRAHIGGDCLPVLLLDRDGVKGEVVVEDKNEVSFRFTTESGDVLEEYCLHFDCLKLPAPLLETITQVVSE